jgi:hypothetical protein
MQRAHTLFAACLILAAGCAESGGSGPAGDPLGTFCWTVADGTDEVCLDDATVHAYRTMSDGLVWFEVEGTIELPTQDTYSGEDDTVTETVTVFGQLPIGAVLPRIADNAVVSMPIAGSCSKTIRISPFGACDTLERASVCRARSVYRSDLTAVTVERLTDQQITVSLAGMLTFDDMHQCCADEPEYCRITDEAAFTPAGPFTIEGRIHVAFGD